MSSSENPEFWSAIYREETVPRWDIGAVAPPLKRVFDSARVHLPKGSRLLVPGCGLGNDVAYLAEAGYVTIGVDFVEEAVIGARSRVTSANAQFVQADLFSLPADTSHAGRYDAVVEHTCFVAIPPERRGDYAVAMHALLREGGIFVGLFYNHGREGGPPFDATSDDILRAFGAHFRIVLFERPLDSHEKRSFREWLVVMEKC